MIKKNHSVEFEKLWASNRINRGPLIFTIIFRAVLCGGIIMYVLLHLFQTHSIVLVALTIIFLMIFAASKQLKKQSIMIERRFKKNFNEKEIHTESRAVVSKGFVNHVLARDLHLAEFPILPYYSVVGKTLQELNFRQYFGVNIVTIVRGGRRINIPNGGERIYPNDHIVLLGTDKQMEIFQKRLEEKRQKYANYEETRSWKVQMEQIQIDEKSHLLGKTIRTSGIHDKFGCLVVGIERNNLSMQNPDLDLLLEEGDILWLVGEYDKVMKLIEE